MKKQASFKEYTVTIADSGSAEVFKLFKNALKGLHEICAKHNLDCPKGYGAGMLGKRILKELNNGDAKATTAVVGNYIISLDPNGSIKVSKIFKNTKAALRELSELVGFDYDESWGTRTFGNKVIDAIESGAFRKLAKARKIEDTVEIEMDEDSASDVAAPQAAAQEIPADAVLLQPEDPTKIGFKEFEFKKFTCVIIPDGVESIGGCGFNSCENLQRVILPEGLEEIGSNAFSDCSELTEINIPASVTEIGYYAFCDCENLQRVILPEGLEKIGSNAFSYCSELTEINIPASVTEIGYCAFCDCENLQRVILPEGLEKIGSEAFINCSELTEINIPASVTEIGGKAFDGCGKLDLGIIFKLEDGVAYNGDKTKIVMVVDPVNVVLPETITEIGDKFCGCETLESIIIPQGLTKIGNDAFCDCENLQRVILPEGLEKIGSFAFDGCSELTEINIPASVTEISNSAFKGCDKILGIIYKLEDGVAYNGDRTKITKVVNPVNLVLPDTITEIESSQFKECETLESIVLPEGLVSIGERAFQSSGLKSIVIPNSIKKLEALLFESCFSMESITLPEGLTEIGYGVFMGCAVESITIPSTVTKIGAAAFACTGGDCDSSLAMGCIEICFEGDCKEIDGVVYNNDCTEIFYLTEDAVAVVIPEGITSLEGKFRGSYIRSIDLSESGVTKLDDWEFDGCDELSEVVFPDALTSIGENAFYGTKVSGYSLPEHFQDDLECYGIEDEDDDDDDDDYED